MNQVENILTKGEIAYYDQFILLSKLFQKGYRKASVSGKLLTRVPQTVHNTPVGYFFITHAEIDKYCKSKKGHNSFKNWRNLWKCEVDLWHMITKPYTKFQVNNSKVCRKKVRETNILSPKRDITHSKLNEIPGNMNLICDTSLQSLIQNFSSIARSM